jgi:hypothetical protein
MDRFGKHETVARACLSYARKEMLEVLDRADMVPTRRAA